MIGSHSDTAPGEKSLKNLRQSIRKRLNRLRHGRLALVKHNNCSFLLDTYNSLDMKIMGGMNWELGLRDRAVAEINANKIDLFIDAGANLGLYSIDLNRRCPSLRETIAFEPVPSNFNQLCGNIFMNGMSERVTPKRYALSDGDGTAVLNIDSKFTVHSSLYTDVTRPTKFDVTIDVSLMKFDDHHNFDGRFVFLKMDIEGHEAPALRGMSGFLTRNKASLQIESAPALFDAVKQQLTKLGYTYSGNEGNDHFFSNFKAA